MHTKMMKSFVIKGSLFVLLLFYLFDLMLCKSFTNIFVFVVKFEPHIIVLYFKRAGKVYGNSFQSGSFKIF